MQNAIINPTPPDLAGLAWRPVGREDLTAIVDLARACYLTDGGLHFMVEPDFLMERYYQDAPGAAIGAFAADGRMVACATVYLGGDTGKQHATIVGQVHPEMRNRGIGTYLMCWSQEQAETLLAAAEAGERHLIVRTESLTESANRLYLAHGFNLEDMQLVMRRDLLQPLPDRSLPPDVTIVTWQPALADQFYQAYHAAFRERPGFPGFTAAEWVDDWTTDRFVPEWSFLACVGKTPVGFLTATTNPPDSLVMQVGVVPSQRRRGISSGLIVETMRRMRADGSVSAELTVNVNNPGAIQTYIELDFTTIGRRARYERISA